MKLDIILVHPTHYFEFLLSNFAKDYHTSVDLQVFFVNEIDSQYPWKSNFRSGYKSKSLKNNTLNLSFLKYILTSKKNTIILVGWERIDKLILILLMSVFNKKYLIYTDTPNTYSHRSFVKKSIRNCIIKFISLTSNGIIVTGNIGVSIIEKWNTKFKNIYNLPFFVNNDYFRPGINKPKTDTLFFSSGRLVNSHKGYDIILQALGNLKKENKISKFSYFIAGSGPDKNEIEQLIIDNNLEKEVTLLGWVEPSELLELYQSATIFIHPARFDPYPNAVLEAMACGLAIIASDRSGSAIDRIIDGFNGVLFKSGCSKSLETKLQELLNDRIIIETLGREARKTALNWPVNIGTNVLHTIAIAKQFN